MSSNKTTARARRMIDQAQALITEDFLDKALRDHAGVEPGDLTALLDLVALGLVNGAWRNSCVEHWHAEGRLSDGDMMRINSHTTDAVRRRLGGWAIEFGITSSVSTGLSEIDAEDVDILTGRLFRWLTNPERKLPIGTTLGQLARTRQDLEEYTDHADHALGAFAGQAEDEGVRYGLVRTAGHGALACRHWWGHPAWPDLVERFVLALDDPAHPHWGPGGAGRTRLGTETPAVRDRDHLRTTLLKAPWQLDTATATWITNAGIRHMTRAVPTSPANESGAS